LLRERVDRARCVAIALGLTGVLLVLQPAADVAVREPVVVVREFVGPS
jgi:drug/metabolite transporter (DMT)-like permease